MNTPNNTKRGWAAVATRLVMIFVALVMTAIALYFLLDVLGSGQGSLSMSLTLLFGLPYILGALIAFLTAPSGKTGNRHYTIMPLVLMPILLVVGGMIVREGAVCIIMAIPLWLPAAIGGSFTVKHLQKKYGTDHSINLSTFDASLVATVFGVLLALDLTLPQNSETFTVTRTATFEAPPEDVWALLLALPDIDKAEGHWTFAQNVMQIPRPRSAVVSGDGIGAVRHATWGDNITFEEHLTEWDLHKSLTWNFVFPNDSISRYTDPHISPDGDHLHIAQGGYRLETLPNGRTRLILHTTYSAQTPVNLYAALWGEIALGGIQGNILKIIEGRLETAI